MILITTKTLSGLNHFTKRTCFRYQKLALFISMPFFIHANEIIMFHAIIIYPVKVLWYSTSYKSFWPKDLHYLHNQSTRLFGSLSVSLFRHIILKRISWFFHSDIRVARSSLLEEVIQKCQEILDKHSIQCYWCYPIFLFPSFNKRLRIERIMICEICTNLMF